MAQSTVSGPVRFVDLIPIVDVTRAVAIITFQSGDERLQFAMTRHHFAMMVEAFRRDLIASETAQIMPFPQKSPRTSRRRKGEVVA